MASSSDLSVKQHRCFMQFNSMQMKIYTSEEVRQISVLEITKCDTFDEVFFFNLSILFNSKRLGCLYVVDYTTLDWELMKVVVLVKLVECQVHTVLVIMDI